MNLVSIRSANKAIMTESRFSPSVFAGSKSIFGISLFAILLSLSLLARAEVNTPPTGISQFVGAELGATIIEPGKLRVTLYTFYNAKTANVPETEQISVLENMVSAAGKVVELKKESESIYDKHPPVGSTMTAKPATKCVVYTGVVDLGLFRTSYDVTWAYGGLRETFNNVELKGDEAIALKVQISNPVTELHNDVPMLGHPPVIATSANSKSTFQLAVADKDETDKVEVAFSAPELLTAPTQTVREPGSMLTERKAFHKPGYKEGYSGELPGAKAFSYNEAKKELHADRPPFGKYLFRLTISDYRNQTLLSSHEAVFILESIL